MQICFTDDLRMAYPEPKSTERTKTGEGLSLRENRQPSSTLQETTGKRLRNNFKGYFETQRESVLVQECKDNLVG